MDMAPGSKNAVGSSFSSHVIKGMIGLVRATSGNMNKQKTRENLRIYM
jgi:hypothetical protein